MPANFSSFSPIDGSIVWEGIASTPPEIDAAMARASDSLQNWQKTPLETRIQIARTYRDKLQSDRAEIEDLIVREVGKLAWEAAGEVNASIAKIELSIQALKQRRCDAPPTGDGPIVRRTEYHALGVAIVLGPFNFPLHLPGGQIVPALLAGNTVVFKPSEQATAIGHWMIHAWHAAGLPREVLQVIVGGPDVATHAIDSRHTSAVFLTGSRAAGRSIHRHLAGRPEVLLALELGGNNPLIVAPDVAEETVGSIVSSSAFVTAGQRCTCARRAIFIESESAEKQLKCLVRRTRELRVGMPGDVPQPHVGPLISENAADSLVATYDKLRSLGCHPEIPLEIDPRERILFAQPSSTPPPYQPTNGRKLARWNGLALCWSCAVLLILTQRFGPQPTLRTGLPLHC